MRPFPPVPQVTQCFKLLESSLHHSEVYSTESSRLECSACKSSYLTHVQASRSSPFSSTEAEDRRPVKKLLRVVKFANISDSCCVCLHVVKHLPSDSKLPCSSIGLVQQFVPIVSQPLPSWQPHRPSIRKDLPMIFTDNDYSAHSGWTDGNSATSLLPRGANTLKKNL